MMNNHFSPVEEVLNRFTVNGRLSRYDDEKDVEIEKVFEEMFQKLGIEKYDITSDSLFECPSYETGYVAIAWIDEDGDLYQYVFQWETY